MVLPSACSLIDRISSPFPISTRPTHATIDMILNASGSIDSRREASDTSPHFVDTLAKSIDAVLDLIGIAPDLIDSRPVAFDADSALIDTLFDAIGSQSDLFDNPPPSI